MKKFTKHFLSLALIIGVMGLPLLSGAQFDPTAGSSGTNLSTDSLGDTLTGIIQGLLALVAILAVLGFVVSGILFITIGSTEDGQKKAKAWLMYSIIGVVVALIGYIVINFISNFLT